MECGVGECVQYSVLGDQFSVLGVWFSVNYMEFF